MSVLWGAFGLVLGCGSALLRPQKLHCTRGSNRAIIFRVLLNHQVYSFLSIFKIKHVILTILLGLSLCLKLRVTRLEILPWELIDWSLISFPTTSIRGTLRPFHLSRLDRSGQNIFGRPNLRRRKKGSLWDMLSMRLLRDVVQQLEGRVISSLNLFVQLCDPLVVVIL